MVPFWSLQRSPSFVHQQSRRSPLSLFSIKRKRYRQQELCTRVLKWLKNIGGSYRLHKLLSHCLKLYSSCTKTPLNPYSAVKYFRKHFLASCPSTEENLHFYSVSACQHWNILVGFAAVWGELRDGQQILTAFCWETSAQGCWGRRKQLTWSVFNTPQKIQTADFTCNEHAKTRTFMIHWLFVARNIKTLNSQLIWTKAAAFCKNKWKSKSISNCSFNSHKLHSVYRP